MFDSITIFIEETIEDFKHNIKNSFKIQKSISSEERKKDIDFLLRRL